MPDDDLCILVFAGLGRGPRGGRDFLDVAGQRRSDNDALGWRSLDIHAAYHFGFGTTRPVFGVPLSAERLGRGRPACLADEGFPKCPTKS